MRVMVVGGGVAGAASAVALRRIGAEVTLYQAHPDRRSGG
jgi:salicylate hydroxylase